MAAQRDSLAAITANSRRSHWQRSSSSDESWHGNARLGSDHRIFL